MYFAGTYDGIFRSTDQGQSWKSVNLAETDPHITSFTAIGENLFAGCEGFKNWGIFRSTDDGRSWAQLGMNLREQRGVFSLAVSGTNILAGCDRGRIYLSPDLGRRWAMVNAAIDPPDRYSNPRTIVLNVSVSGATHLIVGTDHGLFVSTNRGQTWRPTNVTRQVYSLKVVGSAIFAGGAGGVLISKDNGLSWAPSAAFRPDCDCAYGKVSRPLVLCRLQSRTHICKPL
jgi:photosystem II stability/assembly factor-like uncharacterized protein